MNESFEGTSVGLGTVLLFDSNAGCSEDLWPRGLGFDITPNVEHVTMYGAHGDQIWLGGGEILEMGTMVKIVLHVLQISNPEKLFG